LPEPIQPSELKSFENEEEKKEEIEPQLQEVGFDSARKPERLNDMPGQKKAEWSLLNGPGGL